MSRLTRPNSVDVNIIEDHLNIADELTINIERICGRFIGCFYVTPDQMCCFYLLAREIPDEDISHVVVYYLNSEYETVQNSELELLRKYIPNAMGKHDNVKVGLVNVNINSNEHYHLSLFVDAIENSLGPNLLTQFKSFQVIEVEPQDLSSNPLGRQFYNYCGGVLSPRFEEEFQQIAHNFKISFGISERNKWLNSPKISLVSSREHYITTLYLEEAKIVNSLLIHKHQFVSEDHLSEYKALVNRFYNNQVKHFLSSRLDFGNTASCDDHLLSCATVLALNFQPHIFFCLRKNELIHFAEIQSSGKLVMSENNPDMNKTVSRRYDSANSSPRVAANAVRLNIYNDGRYPIIVEPYIDSQATEVMENSELNVEMFFWKDIVKERQKIKDSIVPPIHFMEPFNDLTRRYLEFLPCYEHGLKHLAELWSRHAKSAVIRHNYEACKLSADVRFVIYHFKSYDDLDCLIVIDHESHEYIFLQPDNEEHKDSTKFSVVARRFKDVWFEEYSDYIGRAVLISNGKCHQDYPRLHLLMSLYVIFRLFSYSVELPKKIIYGEWELRKYANNICTQLQVVNSEYNIKNSLIDDQGYLKEGAMQSLASPLRLDNGVVPKDQCMFCKRRGFNNLGRHMSMAHGGQAQMASSSRSK